MKKIYENRNWRDPLLKKILRVMRLTAVIILISLMHVSATVYSQATKLSLSMQETTIKEVLQKIESLSEFRFIYQNEQVDLNKKVDVQFKDERVENILNKIFEGEEIEYSITSSNLILIKPGGTQGYKNLSGTSSAQQKTVSGKVTDSSGQPLPGVTVVIKGTTQGTVTNADGEYTLANIPANATLQFSFVGMKMQEIRVAGKTIVNVTLVEETVGIEEVVAVGYGTQKKVSLTGSIASAKSEQIATTKNQNVQNMLTGKISGLRVVQKTSEPGTFSNLFDIRGFGSPLIVIDGVPRDNICRMDPNEIESISILKDASAAVYGVQAANGVVLVNTKKGKSGKSSIEYTGFYGLQSPIGLPKPVGAIERYTLMNEIYMHNVNNPSIIYSPEEFAPYLDGTKNSTDWYGKVLKSSTPQYQHNLNLSGSSSDGKIDYFVNMGYMYQNGLYKSNDLNYTRYNLRSNINAQITKRIKASFKISGMLDTRNSPQSSDTQIFSALWRSQPNEDYYANNDANYLFRPGYGFHPGAMADSDISGYIKTNTKLMQSQFELQYEIPYIKGLLLKSMFSYDVTINDISNYRKAYNLYVYDAAANTYTASANNIPEQLTRRYNVYPSTLMQLSLNYNKTINKIHNVSALVVYEERTRNMDNFYATREMGLSLDYLFAGVSTNQVGNSDISGIWKNSNKGLIGKFNYDCNGKYLAEFSFRYDGSSKFPKNKQWGFFPALSTGWRVSEEPFFKEIIQSSIINNFKIRASYGIMGDDAASSYQFISGYNYPYKGSSGGLAGGYIFDGKFVNSIGFRNAPNTNITWYEVKTKNAGIDIDCVNGKLSLSLDVFRRDRDGLLANRLQSLPGTFGSTMPQENLNSDQTNGFEISLTQRGKIKDFIYNITSNLSFARSKYMYIEQGPSGNSYDNWRNNFSYRYKDIWFGYGSEGQFESYDQIVNNDYFVGRNVLPGDYIYKDWNNDGTIDSMDKHPIATTTNPTSDDKQNYPLINFGVNLSLEYKGFDLNLLFQGAAQSYVAYREQLLTPLAWYGNALDMFLDRWHPVDPTADPYNPDTEWIHGYYAYTGTTVDENSGFNIQNAAYLRLKSAEFGYTLPKTWINKVGIEGLRLFVNGYNLFTITNVNGIDPEHPSENYGYTYPICRTINTGVTVRF